MKGAGVPSLRGRGRGDLLVRVDVDVPTRLGDEEAELLRRLAELRGEEVAPPEKGVVLASRAPRSSELRRRRDDQPLGG